MMPLRWSFLVGLLGLAACAVGGPGVPPMSSYEVSGRYGYREAALADNRLEGTMSGRRAMPLAMPDATTSGSAR